MKYKVCAAHIDELNGDPEFSIYNIRQNVREIVEIIIAAKFGLEDKNDIDNQLVIEGFQQLQKYYIVRREGIDIAVPIDDLTEEEVNHSVNKLIQASDTLIIHDVELSRYFNIP